MSTLETDRTGLGSQTRGRGSGRDRGRQGWFDWEEEGGGPAEGTKRLGARQG